MPAIIVIFSFHNHWLSAAESSSLYTQKSLSCPSACTDQHCISSTSHAILWCSIWEPLLLIVATLPVLDPWPLRLGSSLKGDFTQDCKVWLQPRLPCSSAAVSALVSKAERMSWGQSRWLTLIGLLGWQFFFSWGCRQFNHSSKSLRRCLLHTQTWKSYIETE